MRIREGWTRHQYLVQYHTDESVLLGRRAERIQAQKTCGRYIDWCPMEPSRWGPICHDVKRKGKLCVELIMRMGNGTCMYRVPTKHQAQLIHRHLDILFITQYMSFISINRGVGWGLKSNLLPWLGNDWRCVISFCNKLSVPQCECHKAQGKPVDSVSKVAPWIYAVSCLSVFLMLSGVLGLSSCYSW